MTTAAKPKARRRKLHPQFLVDANGKRTSVILPVREFEALLEQIEDQEDIEDARAALAEPGDNIPHDEVNRILGL